MVDKKLEFGWTARQWKMFLLLEVLLIGFVTVLSEFSGPMVLASITTLAILFLVGGDIE